MKISATVISLASVAALFGCAGTAPKELVDARSAYLQASQGPAAQMAPAELHKAELALAVAEKSYSNDAGSYQTADLSYVAQRKAEMAEAQASIATEQKSQARANTDFTAKQGEILNQKSQDLTATKTALEVSQRSGQQTAEQLSSEQLARAEAEKKATEQQILTEQKQRDLNQTRTALAVSQQTGQMTAAQLATEQKARAEAEAKSAEAQAALAKLSAIKEDERGMVITLSGSVLFRSDEAVLMPGAESRLDQVVDALASRKDRNVVVEGYTDSQGSDTYNVELSQRRADAVRSYLVSRGYDATRVQAHGLGESRPIADNGTAEGRANNRRVEIVLQREAKP